MTENIIQMLIAIGLIFITAIATVKTAYYQSINNKKLERRTEIFENILRALSKLIDETAVSKGIEETCIEIKNTGIDKIKLIIKKFLSLSISFSLALCS